MGALVFLSLAGFICAGVIWFWIVRPILEDAGLLPPRVVSSDLGTVPAVAGTVPAPSFPAVPDPVPPHRNNGNIEISEVAELLSNLTEDELLTALALIRNVDSSWRYAESRVAKFAPGRDDDRLAQVRAARGDPPKPAPSVRQINVNNGRAIVSMD